MKWLIKGGILLCCLGWPLLCQADDIDLYGSGATQIEPNVLIIFDTSGSMDTQDVPGEIFDPGQVYEGDYESGRVYRRDCWYQVNSNSNSWWCRSHPHSQFCQPSFRRRCSNDWVEFAQSADDIGCQTIKNDLLDKGYATGQLDSSSPYACSGDAMHEEELRTGGFLNFETAGLGETRRRTDVAKEVITDLINRTEGVKFGLMGFNWSEGGRIISEIGASKELLLSEVAGLPADTWTPLAETLAEAGLYFAGKSSWFNSGTTYTSPIEYPCQKNYVILITDGEPTEDESSNLTNSPYVNGDVIGDYDGDGKDPGHYGSNGTDYLDDVAAYLYNEDLRSDMSLTSDEYEKQSVTTYTIGFKTDQPLLEETAVNGGGLYYTAENYTALAAAFDNIINSIQERNAIYVAPVVPVNRVNRTFAGNRVYLGFFKPQASGRWRGNLKSYHLTDNGELLDQNYQPVTDDAGMIIDGTQSLWSLSYDGYEVDLGGVGEVLLNRTDPRNVYTYLGSESDLTAAGNVFSETNSLLTKEMLDVTSGSARSTLISSVRAEDNPWPMGDIVHSEPHIQHYYLDANNDGTIDSSELKTYIFVGANDGMLHVFDDDDGSEVWSFIPPDQLDRLKLLDDSRHEYFVDGSIFLLDEGGSKTLVFGQRRGGTTYTAIDVTDPLSPAWKFQTTASLLVSLDGDSDGQPDGNAAMLGQSWTRPQAARIQANGTTHTVLRLAGGYDVNQDLTTPAASDSVGRAIYAIDPADGSVYGPNINAGNWNEMTHCIIDLSGVDTSLDGYMNRIYAGDLGCHLFALSDDDYNGVWDKFVLLDLPDTVSVDGVSVPLGQKFMYKPEVTIEQGKDMLYIGSGDREAPHNISKTNAVYAVRVDWQKNELGDYVPRTLDDLTDVTNNLVQQGTAEEQTQAWSELNGAQGWYMRLPNAGEKIVSSPILFNKILYFTTYTPSLEYVNVDDPCTMAYDRGVARMYALDYGTGAAAYNLYVDPNDPEAMTRDDRSVIIGTSIPSDPVIAILKGGTSRILIGVEGGVQGRDANVDSTVYQYYWRQL